MIRITRIALHTTVLVLLTFLGAVLFASPCGAQTTLTLGRTAGAGGEYTPGSTLDITVTFTKTGTNAVTQLGLEETIPSGWRFNTLVSGTLPQVPPAAGATGVLDFAYVTPPASFPVTFTYRLTIPASSSGTKSISGRGIYAAGAGQAYTAVTVTSIPSTGASEGEPEGSTEGSAEGAVEGEIEPTVLTLARTVLGAGTYPELGGTVDVQVTITRTGTTPLTQLGLTSVIPSGWTFKKLLSGALPPIAPTSGQSGTLSFAWIALPAFPITFSYRLNVPEASTGTQTVSGVLIYALGGSQLYSDNVATDIEEGATPEGEGEGTAEGSAEGSSEGAADTEVVLTRNAPGGGTYPPGGTVDLTVTLNYTGPETVAVLGLEETIPAGWTFVKGVSGLVPPVLPAAGAQGILGFAWLSVPEFPLTFTYRLRTPVDATGPQTITGEGLYSFGGDQLRTNNVSTMLSEGTPEGEGQLEGEGAIEGQIEGWPEGEINGMVMTRQIIDDGYAPGRTLRIRVTLYYAEPDAVTALAIEENMPAGWTFNSLVSGSLPPVFPQEAVEGPFSFAWLFIPAFPMTFVYRVNVPEGVSGTQQITGNATYYTTGEALYSDPVTTEVPEGTGEGEGSAEGVLEGEGEGEGVLEGEGEAGPVRLTLKPVGGAWYEPGSHADIVVTLAYPGFGEMTGLALSITTPEGWAYDSVIAGSAPPVVPGEGASGELGFAWVFVPIERTSFTFRVNIPETAAGSQLITGVGLYRTTGDQIATNTVALTMNQLGLPDLVPQEAQLPESAWAGQTLNVVYRVANPGSNVADAPWEDCVYLSEDDQFGGDTLLGCTAHDGDVAIGGDYSAVAPMMLPEVPAGDYWIVLAADGSNFVEENDETNNTLVAGPFSIGAIDYAATVFSNVAEAPAGTPITLSGSTTRLSDGTPIGNMPAVIEIVRGDVPQFLNVTSDAQGQFSVIFEPLPTEAGSYTVGARHPGEAFAHVQDNFILHSILAEPSETVIALAPGVEHVLEFTVYNPGDLPLSDLTAEVSGLPANISAEAELVSILPAGETAIGTVTFAASDNSTAAATAVITLSSAQDATSEFDLEVAVAAASPVLQVSSALLRTGAKPAGQTLYRFEVKNTGGAVATGFTVLTPSAYTWISLVAPAESLDIEPGDSVPVTLQLLPPLMQALGTIQTTLEFHYGASATMQVPLRVDVTDQNAGSIQVTVADEFTQTAAGAPVIANALVTLLNPKTGLVEASGVSNAQGRVDFASVAAGVHHLQGFHPQHGRVLQAIVVTPGGFHPVTLRMKRDFARHEWFAASNDAGGYDFTTVAYTGEAGDAPVITVNPPALDLRDLYDPSQSVNLTIANSGTQTAKSVRLDFGEHTRFHIAPAVSELGDLEPGESLTVPVWFADTGFGMAGDEQDCRIEAPSGVLYGWDLKGQMEWRREPIAIVLPEIVCPEGIPQYGMLHDPSGDIRPYVTTPFTALTITCPDALEGDPCHVAILHIEEEEAYPGNSFDLLLLLSSPGALMTSVGAALVITNDNGDDATSLFTIGSPGLTDIDDIAGEGWVAEGGSANAVWRITPKTGAVTGGETRYHVGGMLSFNSDGSPVSVSLVPDTIVVRPWPVLNASLFYPEQVFGEDPDSASEDFSDPFSIGILAEHTGAGTVEGLRLQAAEPSLSVVESGAYGAFSLLTAHEGSESTAAQFPLDLGSLATGGRVIAYWDMAPASSGWVDGLATLYTFRDAQDYTRAFESTAAGTHDLIHVVRLDVPEDDALPDFLTNDTPDAERLPDTLHASDGAVMPVTPATGVTFVPAGKQARITYVLTADMPAEWGYVKAANPVGGDYIVGFVRRQDGTLLPRENAWISRRTVRLSGGAAQEQSFLHLLDYDGAGTYTVQFSSLTETNTLPAADAGPDQTGVYLNDAVTLDGSASVDADGDPITYHWRFTARPQGSGAVLNQATSVSPSFTADRRGDYVVELVVNDTYADSAPDTVTVQVLNRVPIANAGSDQSIRPKTQVTLNGTGSSDADGDPLTYAWTFLSRPAGSTAVLSSATPSAPAFTPDKVGDYVVQLIVNDGFANSAPDSVTIHAVNTVPLANAGPDQTKRVTQTVTLDGSASTDADGDPLAHTWSFTSKPSGSQAVLNGASTASPSFVLDVNGDYVVRLVVNDGFVNSDLDTVTIHTENTPPVANAGEDKTGYVGQSVSLNGSASSDVDKDVLSYSWRFTARPAGSAAALNNASAAQPSFLLDAAGSYSLELVVNDGKTDSAPDTVLVTTLNTPPIADAGTDQGRRVGETVALDGSGSADIDGDTLSYTWSFVSRPASSTAAFNDAASVSPAFVIDISGEYVVRLVVNDGTADSDPDQVTITTQNSVPTANAGSDQTALVGAAVQLNGSQSSDPDDDELSYAWNFVSKPAASTTSLTNAASVTPTLTVDVPGTYVVRLVVNDGQLNSAPDTVTISTENSPPVANAGTNQTHKVGDTVTLSGSKSSDVDKDTLHFQWSFASKPADSAATIINALAVNASFAVDAPGSYVVQLIVNDGKVDGEPAFVTISTENSAPVPDPGEDQTQKVGQKVTLDGSGSVDPDNNELTFRWSFASRPAGSAAVLSDTDTVNPWFIIDEPGTYVVQLIVNDGLLDAAPVTVTISTVNSAPVANAGPDQTVQLGDMVELDGTDSYDVDGDAITYSWSFTSRPLASATNLSSPGTVRPTFVVDTPGTYVVQLFASDGKLYSSPDTVTITTENSAPTADAGADQTRLLGQTVTLDGRASSDPDGDSITYQWSFTSRPAGSAAALSDPAIATPNFRIDKNGSYVVQLVVNDGERSSDPDTVVVSTLNSRPIAYAGLDMSVTEGDLVTLDGRQSSDPDGDTLTYRWSFTSIPAGSKTAFNSASLSQPSFTPDMGGQFIAQLIVNDGALDSTPDSVTIYVDPAGSCLNPPGSPAAISATDGDYADRVVVQWSAVTGATEYRVYRSASDDPASAQAISDWIAATTFDDLTAPEPNVEQPSACGCGAAPVVTPIYQYYWVQARSRENCVSQNSFSDLGYRGQDVSKTGLGWDLSWPFEGSPLIPGVSSVAVPVLPDESLDEQTRLITPEDALYIRLRSDGEDIESVWGVVTTDAWESGEVYWVSGETQNPRDGWAAYYPDHPWQEGENIAMTAGAITVSGKEIGPITYYFEVWSGEQPGEPVWQPGYGELDTAQMDLGVENNTEAVLWGLNEEIAPPSGAEAVAAYLIGPRAAFTAPQRVWLPLPQGVAPDAMNIEYYFDENSGWMPAAQIIGWMVPGSLLSVELPEGTYIGFLVNHGGVVRLTAAATAAVPSEKASVMEPPFGDLLMLALALGTMGWAARRRSFVKKPQIDTNR